MGMDGYGNDLIANSKSHSRTPVTWSYMIARYERLPCRYILRG